MNKEEILARCIDEVLSGRSTVDSCLAEYPALAGELRPLLEMAIEVKPPDAAPSLAFKQRVYYHLQEVMDVENAPTLQRESPHSHWWVLPAFPVRAMVISLAVVLVVLGGGGGVYASQKSLPGEALYPVKTGVEQLQLALTAAPEGKAYLHLKLAQRRVDEVAKQASLNRNLNVTGLAALSGQTDAAIQTIGTVKPDDARKFFGRLAASAVDQQAVLGRLFETAKDEEKASLQEAITVTQRINLIAQAAFNNPEVLLTKPSVRDEKLEEGRIKVEGVVLSLDGGTWNIGGVTLSNVHYFLKEMPVAGSRVKVEALARDSQVYIIKAEQTEGNQGGGSGEDTRIRGVFNGTDESGLTWYVGGASIGMSDNQMPPAKGGDFELEGTSQNGAITITRVASRESVTGEGGGTRVEGTLASVDADGQTIKIKVAGADVNIDVSKAALQGDNDNEKLKPADLTPLVGKDVTAEGLTKKDGVVQVKKVSVERGGEKKEGGQENKKSAPGGKRD